MSAIHVALNKKRQAQIDNRKKLPSGIANEDASNCFDRVARPTASMMCRHFSLPLYFVTTFFDTIQNMKMCLMKVHGMSTNFYSGQDLPFQGLMQGNGAASQEFLLLAIILIKYLHKKINFRINASNHE